MPRYLWIQLANFWLQNLEEVAEDIISTACAGLFPKATFRRSSERIVCRPRQLDDYNIRVERKIALRTPRRAAISNMFMCVAIPMRTSSGRSKRVVIVMGLCRMGKARELI